MIRVNKPNSIQANRLSNAIVSQTSRKVAEPSESYNGISRQESRNLSQTVPLNLAAIIRRPSRRPPPPTTPTCTRRRRRPTTLRPLTQGMKRLQILVQNSLLNKKN